jgi:septin family protein
MKINNFRIKNYKSFEDSNWINLGQNFNLIVGQNNSGKTALLETLDQSRFANKPHRSLEISPTDAVDPISLVETTVSIPGKILKKLLLDSNVSRLRLPGEVADAGKFLDAEFAKESLDYRLSMLAGLQWTGNVDDGSMFSLRGNTNWPISSCG